MKTRLAIVVASAVAVAGAGTLIALTMWVDPTWLCERRADAEFEQLEALAAPLADKQVGETSRDFECWGSEPRALVSVRLPKELSPVEAMTLLGDNWQVTEQEREGTTTDGNWQTSSHRWSGRERSYTMVVFHRTRK